MSFPIGSINNAFARYGAICPQGYRPATVDGKTVCVPASNPQPFDSKWLWIGGGALVLVLLLGRKGR